MSPFLAIPNELIHHIIGLNCNDKETLKNCSLVCATFSAPSQAYIFRKVTLHNSDEFATTYQFSSLIIESPHIAGYIHNLEIGSGAFDHSALGPTLRELPHVTSLMLFGSVRFSSHVRTSEWQNTSFDLLDALESHILPSIEKLDLECFDFHISLLPFCRSLKWINVFHSNFIRLPCSRDSDDSIASSFQYPLNRLTLTIGDAATLLPFLVDFIRCGTCKITHLDIELLYGVEDLDIHLVAELFDSCCGTLRSIGLLTINDIHTGSLTFFKSVFSISNFIMLNALSVTINIWKSFSGPDDARFAELDWVAEVLEGLYSSIPLEQVTIEVWIECKERPLFRIKANNLDHSLKCCFIPSFSRLVVASMKPSPFFEDITNIFRCALPITNYRGLLRFEDAI